MAKRYTGFDLLAMEPGVKKLSQIALLAALAAAFGPRAVAASTFVNVTPNNERIELFDTQQFTALDEDGASVSVTWSAGGSASLIDAAGLFTSDGTIGTFIVTATRTDNGNSGSANIFVDAPPVASNPPGSESGLSGLDVGGCALGGRSDAMVCWALFAVLMAACLAGPRARGEDRNQ